MVSYSRIAFSGVPYSWINNMFLIYDYIVNLVTFFVLFFFLSTCKFLLLLISRRKKRLLLSSLQTVLMESTIISKFFTQNLRKDALIH